MGNSSEPKIQRFGPKSVFVRCAGIVAATTVVVAGVLSIDSAILIRNIAVETVVSDATKSVSQAADTLVKPVRFKAVPKIEETITQSMESAGPNGTAMLVINAEDTILASIGEDAEALSEIHLLATEAGATLSALSSANGMMRAEPIFAAPGGPLIGVVAAAWNADAALNAAAQQSARILATAGLIFAAMMAVALYLFKRVLGNPLKAVAATITRVGDGQLDDPIALAKRKDEFGLVGRQIESLVSRLKQARELEASAAKDAKYQAEVVAVLGKSLDALADGVLNQDIIVEFTDDYATLRENYNRAVGQLRNLINEVASSAAGLQDNADQIAASSNDLSKRTETQAATLEQSAAALEELLANVDSAAKNARQAVNFVKETRNVAEENGQIMQSAMEAMTQIEKSSEEISAITNVIDDIAFQTNLLALNAGVEAARAGASGKGFAVVATEVRGLAQRSAAAAQQIKGLIDSSSDQVETGVQLVKEAGKTLETVLDKVAGVSEMVDNIAAGADEQSGGLKEINVGISNLDRVTQQNASMVQDSASSAFDMRAKAKGLAKLVSQFDTQVGGAPVQKDIEAA